MDSILLNDEDGKKTQHCQLNKNLTSPDFSHRVLRQLEELAKKEKKIREKIHWNNQNFVDRKVQVKS